MNTLPEFKTILQKDLSELMQAFNTKNELLEFADLFGLPYKQSLKKKALAEILELKLLQHPEVLMNVLPKKELLSLQKLVHAGGYLKSNEELNFFELEYRTIVFRARQKVEPHQVEDVYFEYALPGNLQRTLQTKIDKMVNNPYVDAWERKDRIFVGLMQLYGVLSKNQFFMLWEKSTGEKLDLLDFLKMLRSRSQVRGLCNPFYTESKLCISNANVEYPEDLYAVVMKRKDLDYHIYSLETILMSSDSYLNIIEPKKLAPLVAILDKMNEGNETLTTIQLTGLWMLYQNGAPHGDLITFLANKFSFDSLEHVNKLVSAMTFFTNALPNWMLKGHSPDELLAKHPLNIKDPQFRKQVNDSFSKKFPNEASSAMDNFWNQIDQSDNVVPFTLQPTISRNDPCPCGSGKKYKKCCGAN